jgi:hypothetical protein
MWQASQQILEIHRTIIFIVSDNALIVKQADEVDVVGQLANIRDAATYRS